MGVVLPFNRTRQVNQRTLNLIMNFEDYATALPDGRCMAYLDTAANKRSWSPGYDGLWTIGYGSTGPGITEGTIWTKQQAINALHKEVNQKAAEVSAYLTYPVNDNQFGALVSLAYNVGTGGIHGILNLVNEGRLDEAANAFLEYNHSDGQVLNGLTRRRYAEKELFEWEVPAEVSSMSPMMRVAQYGKTATAGLTVTGASMWEFIGNAKTIATDNAGWILLGVGCIVFLVFHYFQNTTQSNFDSGSYVPPGTKPIDELPPEVANAPIVPTNKNLVVTKAPTTSETSTTRSCSVSIPQIIAAVGGTTMVGYILLALFLPSLLALITPIITEIVYAIASLAGYLWGGFLFLSQSVPAMLLVLFLMLGAFNYGSHKGVIKTWHKAHSEYTLTKKKPKIKSDTYNIFRHPLGLLN